METDRGRQQAEKDLKEAPISSEIPHLYANSFTCGVGMGDIVIVLKNAEKHVATLNLSYTVAKTLALKLGEGIADLESKTGTRIMTTDDINKSLAPKS